MNALNIDCKISVPRLTVLLGLLTAFAPFSTDMYLAAFPAMARDMFTDMGHIQLTLSVFFWGLAVGQLVYGPLSDRFGRRRPLLAGILLYTLASLGLVFVRDIEWFIALRFVQAVGGCAGLVIGRAVISDAFDVAGAAKILTIMMAVQAIGPVAAPMLGGYMLNFAPWAAQFGFMTVLGVLCFLASWAVLPETLAKEKRQHQSPRRLFGVFWQLFRKREFCLPVIVGATGGAIIFVFIGGSPFVLMSLYGLSETRYGLTFGLIALGTALLSQVNVLLLKRFHPRQILTGGLIFAAIFSLALVVLVFIKGQPDIIWFIALAFMALAAEPIIYANSAAVAMAAGRANAGSASSIIGVAQFTAAGVVNFAVSLLHNGTIMPMVGVMVLCSILALVVLHACK